MTVLTRNWIIESPDDPRHPFYWCRRIDSELVSQGLRPIFCPRCTYLLSPCELHYPTSKITVKRDKRKKKKVKI